MGIRFTRLRQEAPAPKALGAAVQRLLDGYQLSAISIQPEMRQFLPKHQSPIHPSKPRAKRGRRRTTNHLTGILILEYRPNLQDIVGVALLPVELGLAW